MKHYVFRDAWHVEAAPAAVHAVLSDVEHYPTWWPQVRAVVRIDDDSGLVACRSVLPYTLHLRLTAVHRLPHLLETAVDGDLVGSVRWLLAPEGAGTALRFEQEVTVSGRALAFASYVGRPALRWNHHQMMRGAEKGLAQLLSSAGR